VIRLRNILPYFLSTWCLIYGSYNLFAQDITPLRGRVTDLHGQALQGVTISLLPKAEQTLTDAQGHFLFPALPKGQYQLAVQYLGFALFEQTVQLPLASDSLLKIILQTESTTLDEVHIQSENENDRVRKQVLKALVVDTRQAAEQPTTLAELMNRTTGIRMRQSGGLGHGVDVSINGFQGNSVQYFRDGIPLDYLGSGYGLHAVPVNLLERVEIYKGVIPIRLGGDALGGAVHLISRKPERSTVNASYALGSFHTHVAQLNVYHTRPGAKWFIGMEGFYNDAKNDYRADVQVVNEQANLEDVRVKLFHNGYQHAFGEAYAGLKNLPWADELRFSVAGFGLQRESQHPALMTNPYGAVMVHQKGWIPSLRYQKSLWNQTLHIDQFLTYSKTERGRTDTLHGTYNWYGEFTPSTDMGESPRKSLSRIDFSSAISRTHLTAKIHPQHQIEMNWTLHWSHRLGEDPYGFRFEGTDIDVLSKKANYNKTVGGLSWQSLWLDNRLTNVASVKYFYFQSKGINGFMANETTLNDFQSFSQNHWGFSNALKYQVNAFQFVRASLEWTNRLPRENELFGDHDTRAPNFELKPERSLNAQISYAIHKPAYQLEIGGFYRKTKGMIMLIPVQPPFAQYQNLDSVRGYGFEIDAKVPLHEQIQLLANVTWQDNRMVQISSPVHQWMEGTRLRNTPYFFANAGIQSYFEHIIRKGDRIQPYIHWNFIREFYLNNIPRDKEPGGFLGLFGQAGVPVTNVVPDQHLLSLGTTYFIPNRRLAVSGEIKNILDAKLYDYYKIQRPGRSFHLKLTYNLHL
jgi:outer membrane receptor protein involved in Fe transport